MSDNHNNQLIATKPDVPTVELNIDIVKRYICPTATDQEAFAFLQLCQAQGLNPFLREAYLVKYDPKAPGSMVVGKEAFAKRADRLEAFDGFEAGIIVKDKAGMLIYRQGSLVIEGEVLVGGYATVWRKDRAHPFRNECSLKEYDRRNKSWREMPATMIRKVALVQSLREAFPTAFGGLYAAEEMPVEPSTLPTEAITVPARHETPTEEPVIEHEEDHATVTADGEILEPSTDGDDATDLNGPATKEQLFRINELLLALGHNKRPRKIWFVKHNWGFNALDLTVGQAEEVITGLEDLVQQKENSHDE